jgi:hypothetical protein
VSRREAVLLVAGLVLGALLVLGAITITDSRYTYRVFTGNRPPASPEEPIDLIAKGGCEVSRPFGGDSQFTEFRCPRLHL